MSNPSGKVSNEYIREFVLDQTGESLTGMFLYDAFQLIEKSIRKLRDDAKEWEETAMETSKELAETLAANARLRAALGKALEGLDLAHSCGIPPHDVSGRKMWLDSSEIRMRTRQALSAVANIVEE